MEINDLDGQKVAYSADGDEIQISSCIKSYINVSGISKSIKCERLHNCVIWLGISITSIEISDCVGVTFAFCSPTVIINNSSDCTIYANVDVDGIKMQNCFDILIGPLVINESDVNFYEETLNNANITVNAVGWTCVDGLDCPFELLEAPTLEYYDGEWTPFALSKLREIFDRFDVDMDGCFNLSEINAYQEATNSPEILQTVPEMIELLGGNGIELTVDGRLTFKGFCQLCNLNGVEELSSDCELLGIDLSKNRSWPFESAHTSHISQKDNSSTIMDDNTLEIMSDGDVDEVPSEFFENSEVMDRRTPPNPSSSSLQIGGKPIIDFGNVDFKPPVFLPECLSELLTLASDTVILESWFKHHGRNSLLLTPEQFKNAVNALMMSISGITEDKKERLSELLLHENVISFASEIAGETVDRINVERILRALPLPMDSLQFQNKNKNPDSTNPISNEIFEDKEGNNNIKEQTELLKIGEEDEETNNNNKSSTKSKDKHFLTPSEEAKRMYNLKYKYNHKKGFQTSCTEKDIEKFNESLIQTLRMTDDKINQYLERHTITVNKPDGTSESALSGTSIGAAFVNEGIPTPPAILRQFLDTVMSSGPSKGPLSSIMVSKSDLFRHLKVMRMRKRVSFNEWSKKKTRGQRFLHSNQIKLLKEAMSGDGSVLMKKVFPTEEQIERIGEKFAIIEPEIIKSEVKLKINSWLRSSVGRSLINARIEKLKKDGKKGSLSALRLEAKKQLKEERGKDELQSLGSSQGTAAFIQQYLTELSVNPSIGSFQRWFENRVRKAERQEEVFKQWVEAKKELLNSQKAPKKDAEEEKRKKKRAKTAVKEWIKEKAKKSRMARKAAKKEQNRKEKERVEKEIKIKDVKGKWDKYTAKGLYFSKIADCPRKRPEPPKNDADIANYVPQWENIVSPEEMDALENARRAAAMRRRSKKRALNAVGAMSGTTLNRTRRTSSAASSVSGDSIKRRKIGSSTKRSSTSKRVLHSSQLSTTSVHSNSKSRSSFIRTN